MKDKIRISLFFSILVIGLCIGIAIGLNLNQYKEPDPAMDKQKNESALLRYEPGNVIVHDEKVLSVTSIEDKITADTSYMILEKDMNTGEIQKKSVSMPQKYIGLTRQQIIEQLQDFETNPPLVELEKGFVSLELISFSPEQLEIQMNYKYVTPTGIFYIMSYDNKVVVMLEDKKTVFLSTEINMSELPSEVQQDIMRGLFIPNEQRLYDFLENYTS